MGLAVLLRVFMGFFFEGIGRVLSFSRRTFHGDTGSSPSRCRVFFFSIFLLIFSLLSLSLSLCLSLFVLLLFTEWFISGCRSGWSASGFHGRIPPLTPATGPWLFWACVIDPLLSFLSFFFFSLSFSLFVFFRFRPSPQRRQCASLAPLSTLIGH